MLQTLPAELVAEVAGVFFREVLWWFPGKVDTPGFGGLIYIPRYMTTFLDEPRKKKRLVGLYRGLYYPVL